MKDYKNYKAEDGVHIAKTTAFLIIFAILAAIAYASNQDYEECLAGSRSVTLCGGGNTK